MARYIDADKLWNDRPQIPEGKSMDFDAGFSECMWGFSRNIRKQIDTESADVVPKSEIAREIFEEIDKILNESRQGEYSKEFGFLNRVSYNGYVLGKGLAELKKKYTE